MLSARRLTTLSNRLPGRVGTLAAVVFVFASCNAVKEERRQCPCILSVEMEGLPAYPAALYVNDSLAGEARRDTTLQLWVEKGGNASLVAVSGARPSEDLTVRIPYGRQAPPLYGYRDVADCTADYARARVSMNRHFCTLSVRFTGPPGWGAPLSVALRGSVNGFSLRDGEPLEGEFYCRLDGTSSCRVPRHRPGDPLWMDIVLEDNVLRSFPLGTYLEQAGFDWTAPDLPDQAVDVDVSVSSIRFQTGGWSQVENLEIVI